MKIHLQWGIPKGNRVQVATLLYDTFEYKFRYVLGPRNKGIPFITHYINERYTLVALVQNQVVGVAGIKLKDGEFLKIKLGPWLRSYHLWALRGILIGFPIFINTTKFDELKIDSIAVIKAMRSQGIGTRLIDEIKTFSSARGFQRISLDVINTNIRARILYERTGFRIIKFIPIPRPWSSFLGFTGVFEMVYEIG